MADAPDQLRTTRPFPSEEDVRECDVCGSNRIETIAPSANVVQCTACGYRFVSPRPSQATIAAAYSSPHFYDGWVAADAGRLSMWKKRFEQVRRAASGPRLLDIGAGIGTFLAVARDRAGWSVTGTEVSTAAIDLARERLGIQLVRGRVEELDLPRQSFNVITLWHVLEHVPSPSRLLRACHDLLEPGGHLIFAVPNDSDSRMRFLRLKERARRLVGRGGEPAPRYYRLTPGSEIHLSHFTLPVVRRLLKKEGFLFKGVTVDDHYPEPTPRSEVLVGLYRIILRLSGRNLGQAMLVVARRE
jgi:SAM-dependent methyltransferase